MSELKKKKYLQIFNYLKEFSKLRSNPVRDIDIQETQYPEKFWLHEIPDDELFENIIRDNFNDENDYWLKIKKPKEPQKPEFAKLPVNLEKWIDKSTLLDYVEGIKLLDTVEVNGAKLSIKDYPEVQKEFNLYKKKNWATDLFEYNYKVGKFKPQFEKYEKLNSAYKQLFRIYNKAQQFGEEYELIVGVGLLNFKENNESPKIFRHILTQRVDINFEYNQKDSHILVSPNIESKPQIETDSILDLRDQFEIQNIIDAEKEAEQYLKGKNIDTLFHNTEDALKIFAERFSPDGSYNHLLEKPSNTPKNPKITFAPALLLRKRNTRNFTALYETIISNIENGEEKIEISTLNDLIGIPQLNDTDHVGIEKELHSKFDQLFFPKEYNSEQIEIIEKIKKSDKVLVQGPPGTGKSHTIANLICHLLANGKKVLITAYTKRALEVLKDKLPYQFQNLVVNLLSSDPSSLQSLQSSVNAINDELSRASLNEYKSKIEETEVKLNETRELIAKNSNSLTKVKEKATRINDVNEKYAGTLTELAEKLERDALSHNWYKDDFSNIENEELLSKLKLYIQLHEKYDKIENDEFEYEIPDPKKLVPTKILKDLTNLNKKLTNGNYADNVDLGFSCSNLESLNQLLQELLSYYNNLDNFRSDFASILKETYAYDRNQNWVETLNCSTRVIERLENHELQKIDKDIEVTYPQDKSLKQLKKDAQILLEFLNKGNSLTGIKFKLKKPILHKEIKERLYFIDSVRVNGSPCDTIEEFETVLIDIDIQQDFEELSEIWKKEVPKALSLYKKFEYYKKIQEDVTSLVKQIEKIIELKSEIESISTLKIKLFDKDELSKAIQKAEHTKLIEDINRLTDLIGQSKAYLVHGTFHPIKGKIIESIENVDYLIYSELLNESEKLIEEKEKYMEYTDLLSFVFAELPNVITSVNEKTFSVNDIQKLEEAIFFKNAKLQLDKLMDINYENQLTEDLLKLESAERDLVATLASLKTWYNVILRLQKDRSLRQNLEAWVMAVKRIGKTGTGKRAMKFRKIAQQKMEHCKDSVPCWIMPLYKVAETIQPVQGMYDYVIIDEASQLGADAIFLLYISKNIIIVGDDKQTSPEYIGVDADIMTPYIMRYLNGIPFSDYYGTEFSFFDHAKLFCDGVTVLREHFRCMPEIIEFSNRHFYAPDGKALYPLKQYSENRLPPLVTKYCETGYTEGTGSSIINKPEAKKITETIGLLIDDKKYKGKTIGVISLQGNKQSSIIENLLLKRIGEKEFHERKIICGNSSSFQGDERDIIILSLVTAPGHNRSPLVRPEDERRFNVAVSRAKEQVWLFHSVQLDDLSNTNDLRYKLLDHFKNYNSYQKIFNKPVQRRIGTQPEPFDSWFEVDVYNDIVNKQLSVIPQYEVANGKYRIDMVALLPNGTKIAIECDGDKWHGQEHYQNDIMRQRVLERCGWQFFRVRGYEYYSNRKKALEPLWRMIPANEEINEPNLTTYDDKPTNAVKDAFETDAVSNIPKSDTITKITKKESKTDVKRSMSSSPNSVKTLRYFNLYKSGKYIVTINEPHKADYVIKIQEEHKNGFILQCYKSGHVNKVHISVILSKKIGKEYMNGIHREGELTHIQAIESEKIIGIYFSENGRRIFKAHLTNNISVRENLNLQGYKVIYNDFEKVEYAILPLEIQSSIRRLIFQSFTANGKPIDNKYYEPEFSILREYTKKRQDISERSGKFLQRSLFEPKVGLNSIVVIKYTNNNKVMKVKLVNKPTGNMKTANGTQPVNVSKPLAIALNGKKIGDRVRVGNTNSEVEIIDIQ